MNLEMKLFWSEYKNGKWESKKMSNDALLLKRIPYALLHSCRAASMARIIDGRMDLPDIDDPLVFETGDHPVGTGITPLPVKLSPVHVFLGSFILGRQLFVQIYQWDNSQRKRIFLRGDFIFDGCNSSPALLASGNQDSLYALQSFNNDKLLAAGASQLQLNGKRFFEAFHPPAGNIVLEKLYAESYISLVRHAISNAKRPVFFLGNTAHLFFVNGLRNTGDVFNDSLIDSFNDSFALRRISKPVNGFQLPVALVVDNTHGAVAIAAVPEIANLILPMFQRKYAI